MLLDLGPEGEFEKKRLSRLVKLQKCDKGFFLLGSHSYIESWLRQKLHLWEDENSFSDLIFKFKIFLIENANGFPPELSVLQNLRMKEKTAIAVIHSFVDISDEETSAAAYRLLQFCKLADIQNTDELESIRIGFEYWSKRHLIADDELQNVKQQLALSINRNKDILAEVEKLRLLRAENQANKQKIIELEARLNNQQIPNSNTDRLKTEITQFRSKQERNTDSIAELKVTDEYIQNLARLTSYTRTRLDFERDLTRLTPEQQDVLESINLTDDFLIKGGAGTGKTLVLIKALEKALSIDKSELNFDDNNTTVRMLTYNRTLAKYDRYIAELLKQNDDASKISTIDKFLYDKLREINSAYRIEFSDNYVEELLEDLNTTDFFSSRELSTEIDGYIFSSVLTEDEYLKPGHSPGFGSRLKPYQRQKVWEISRKLIDKMDAAGAYSKNCSRLVILNHLSSNSAGQKLRNTDFTFIDEVQDLTAADIRAVKACTRRAVIMAGDSDQSIYQDGFTFTRAGIDIRGRARILRTNFRNSFEIQAVAEAYRLKHSSADASTRPKAFRTGPPPEAHSASTIDELNRMIVNRARMFVEELSYDSENICILVPSSRDIEPIANLLKNIGLESADLRNDDFSFNTRGIIRISTMHSSKGLDFPVVLLNIHRLPQTTAGDDTAQEKMRRNLIYVSMTRAMDNLNIFTLKNEKSPEITDLTGLL